MAVEDDVLALLTGAKVFDGHTWRVYDSGGTEIADPGGVLWRGVHGALLWGASRAQGGLDGILAILTGRKIFDGNTWRVFSPGGEELVHTGGVLWRGVHGALLWNVNKLAQFNYPIMRRRRHR